MDSSDYQDVNEAQLAEMKKNALLHSKMFKDTFNTPSGEKLLKYLKEQFVDCDIYRHGQTYEHTAFRQGQASMIKKIITEVERNG